MYYASMFEEELIFGVVSGVLSGIPSMLFGVAAYVLMAMALQTVGRRRGLDKLWLAWVPVVNVWLLGSLADQYRYVLKGETKSKRKWLLGLSVAGAVLSVVMTVLVIVTVAGVLHIIGYGATEQEILSSVMGPLLGMAGVAIPMAGISLAYAVIRYMALYDVLKSMDPNNCVVYLVLSILFHIEALFLFLIRNKDNGMPPRRQPEPAYTTCEQPQWQPEEQKREFWETENKDYL